jgi:pimeloyl-ACP methyl ester carboxylesterase
VTYELTERTTINGVDLAWGAWGPSDGEPLLLLHGYTGSAGDFELHVPALLDRGYRVILVEQRGHARSGKGEPADYTLDQLADDLLQLLPVVSPTPVTLLGHSMGGRVAMLVAIKAQDQLRSLILMDTSAGSFRDQDPDLIAMLEAILAAFEPGAGLPDELLVGPEDELVRSRVSAEYMEHRRDLQRQMDPFALKQLAYQLMGHAENVGEQLRLLRLPVTVIVGSLDSPLAEQAPLIAEQASGELVVIDGAYHSPQLTHQSEWLAAIEGHLKSL